MSTRVRTALQTMKAPPKQHQHGLQGKDEKEKGKMTTQAGGRRKDALAKAPSRCRRERKIALQQDVDKLKKKLRHEENIHRALERAFTRPLGALPRLPPYLPPYTLELLAEVAVLEEEVVRLEEQVVNFRHGLYQEAIYISSSKKLSESGSDLYPPNINRLEQSKSSAQFAKSDAPISNDSSPTSTNSYSDQDQNGHPSCPPANSKRVPKKPNPCPANLEERCGKENKISNSPLKNNKESPQKKPPINRVNVSSERRSNAQLDVKTTSGKKVEAISRTPVKAMAPDEESEPNKISEDLLKCLCDIFSRMNLPDNSGAELDTCPSVSGSTNDSEDISFRDPYGVCTEYGKRDIGPYRQFQIVEGHLISSNLAAHSSFTARKLKLLLRKLATVDLQVLTHQQKLAFWINIYNSCMMNAFLENGIPSTPQMVVSLMQKAMINVGGHLLSAMTIEHFILRLPYHSKNMFSKGLKIDEMTMRSIVGLDWPEPLVTFALSCGSWSSPAVRVYTASQVENELEIAKRDYLQAAVGISNTNKMAIPKLLDWYMLDFAKDVESLMDWICLQLPSGLRNEAVKCLERGRGESVSSEFIQVMPYDFSFRYLLAT
ncbi:hypothetical protein Taro_015401 [Colocasia esculenta]|uniref:Uncharacterized protein n=1 Tax=Colocasia esculenta TaxID=4460 RepID=A0A843UHE9_COLES|nr:hypothetical protein [Colocasia esculenta]